MTPMITASPSRSDSPAETSALAIRCRNVTKHYGSGDAKVIALRGIDLDVRQGELMMLVGPSGCGKTTLISVIAGILDRDEGECSVFDQDFSAMSQRARTLWRGQKIGFVFQAFNLIPTLNAAENVAVPLMILGESRAAAVRKAQDRLAQVGLESRWRSYPNQLSGGQQQRVAIARAMIHEPKLIVCDEPTSALDHETGHVIMRLLKTVALQPDRALVIVTHDARIFGFADRIAKMDDGRVVKIVDDPNHLHAEE
ncbi:MAG: ABC transporter ATP-binding protein [Phycisphaerales bacterium]|nr:ABC transporter ATP-binding protein [Phycisphaerales bacterium]